MTDPTPGNDFTLGVNYWPRKKAMYWWNNFDAGEVRDEFSVIRELGMNVVRIFLLWDDFQPESNSISKEAMSHLATVADIAGETNLGLDVTFFTGHMSGPNWSPRWLLGGELPFKGGNEFIRDIVSGGKQVPQGYYNMFHHEEAIKAERLLLKTVVGMLKDHNAVWMWNLANEPDLFAWPLTSDEGAAWVKQMVGLIKSIDPNHPVTIGLHGDGLHRDNGLRIDKVYKHTDVAVMHSYPMYTPWARKPLDPDFVPFTCALTAALAGKPVLMEEFGGPTAQPGEPSHMMKWTETNGRPARTVHGFRGRVRRVHRRDPCPSFRRAGLPGRWSGATQTIFPNSGTCLPAITHGMSGSLVLSGRWFAETSCKSDSAICSDQPSSEADP